MLSVRLTAAGLCLVGVATLGAGCDAGEAAPAADPSTTPAPAPTVDPTTGVGLVVDPNDGSISCAEKVALGGRVSLYDPTVLAQDNVTIVDARIAGTGVRLLHAESVVSLAPVTNGPGALVDDVWPMPLSGTRAGSVDQESRQPLIGTTVSAGTRILPLISFTVTRPGGARADALVLTYLTDGDTAERTARVPLGMDLPTGKCR
jgi:hypothetical protein